MQPLLLQPDQTKLPPGLTARVTDLGRRIDELAIQQESIAELIGIGEQTATRLSVFHGYIAVFVIAFVVTILATPLVRWLALSNGIVDHPSDIRKMHRKPVAYLGGVAIFLGLMGGLLFAVLASVVPGLLTFHPTEAFSDIEFHIVPPSILMGMFVIMLVGLLDDVVGIEPWTKIGGQLIAAAALAYDKVGRDVAAGLLIPIAEKFGIEQAIVGGVKTIGFSIPIAGGEIPVDIIYWTGTAIIAIFILGACNASNLLDGLDGLLTGVTAIAAFGLLIVALSLAVLDDGPRDAQRIILCMALLGACLGFLPHNFNPATIFLGDCGSLLLGFCTIVIILTLGDTGKTHLVLAGLIIYAVPIIDTVLSIVRRKMAGKSISQADDGHLHHMLKRAMGVKGAVFTLYGIGAGFAALGLATGLFRARVTYAIVLIFAAYIGVAATKAARRTQLGLAHPDQDPAPTHDSEPISDQPKPAADQSSREKA